MSEDDTERRYQETRKEHQWYRKRLLDMVESGDKGSNVWDQYRTEMKEVGRREMRLAKKLRSLRTDSDRTEGSR